MITSSGSLTVLIKKDDDSLAVPQRMRQGDAGYDLESDSDTVLAPLERKLISTGLYIAMPPSVCALVMPRSGLALKHGVTVLNTPGLIDSNYRGEIKVLLYNTDNKESFVINKGDRIAQLVFIAPKDVCFEEVAVLPDSLRGQQGYGSTGVSAANYAERAKEY